MKKARNGIWALAAVMLIGSSCTFEEPGKPYWDVTMEVPLFAKGWALRDIADEIEEVRADEVRRELIVSFDQEIETFGVGDKLKTDGVEERNSLVPVGGAIDESVTIPSDVVILERADIQSGEVGVVVSNNSGDAVTLDFIIDEVTDAGGTPFQITESIEDGVTRSIPASLGGYAIEPALVDGESVLHFSGSTAGSGAGDITIDVIIGEMTYSYVAGILNKLEVEIDSVDKELDIPDAFDEFQLDTVSMKLAVSTGLEFPVIVDLKIKGFETTDNTPREILVRDTLAGSGGGGSGVDTVVVNDLAEFINSHPERVRLSGTMIIGDGETADEITRDHVITAEGFFEMPLTLQVPAYESELDVDTLEIDEDAREAIRDNLSRVRLEATIRNGTALGFSAYVLFSSTIGDSLIYLPGNASVSDSVIVEAAPHDNGNPAVATGVAESTILIELDKDELELFSAEDREEVYMGIKFSFSGTGGMVRFQPADSLFVRSKLTIEGNTRVPEDDG